jgi:hypothetical protein
MKGTAIYFGRNIDWFYSYGRMLKQHILRLPGQLFQHKGIT